MLLAGERTIAGAAGFPLDDSWIHLHFARNLAEGHGFSYNPGVPVAGSTAPLWTLLLAAGAWVAGPSVAMVKVIGVLTTLAAALVTRRAALAWGAGPGMAVGAGVAVLWAGPLAWGALSGMEVPLAALLVAGSLLGHARGRGVVTAALAALAALARPEALVLAPLLALAGPLGARRLALFAATATLLLLPAVIFSLATAGTPVPATATAKVEGGLLGWLGGVSEPAWRLLVERPGQFLGEWGEWLWATHPLLPLLLVPAVGAAWVRSGRALGLPALALLAHPLAMALLAPYRGPGFQEGRYSSHLLPLAAVLLAVLPGRRPGGGGWRRPAAAAAAVYLALAVVALAPAARRYGWGVQNINAMQVHLGHWVEVNTPRRARLALNDIGAIAYLSRREVIDLIGLVTPEIRPYRRQGEAAVLRFLLARCPEYVIVFPSWFPALTARTDLLDAVYRVRLESSLVAGGPEMVVYRLTRCGL